MCPSLHCSGHSRWGLWNVTTGGQECGASMNRTGALTRVRTACFSSLWCDDRTRRWQEDGTFLSPTILALWAWTSGLQNNKQLRIYLFKLPSWWYSVIATQAKTQLTDIHFIYWVVFQLHYLSLLELFPLWPLGTRSVGSHVFWTCFWNSCRIDFALLRAQSYFLVL